MSRHESLVGKQIDQFRLDQFIAKGAMGMVYKAFDTVLVRTVALKLISKRVEEELSGEEAATREEARKRLIQEAKAAGRLAHPNIVTIHSYGETEEFEYICMEYVPGKTLTQVLNEQRVLSTEDSIEIFEQILLALDAANKERIVHRDIKPGNIMVSDDGRVKVMDFGIAKLPSFSMTTTGTVLGTPYYMSPEQITGQKVDIRSDVFSVGAVLYQALTGERPFEAANTATLAYKIVQVEPIPPDVLNIHIPHPLGDVVRRALAKNPADRYQAPLEMLQALRSAKHRAFAMEPESEIVTILADGSASVRTVYASHIETARESVETVSASLNQSGSVTFQAIPSSPPASPPEVGHGEVEVEEAARGSRPPAESSPRMEAAAPPEVDAAGPTKVESKEKEAPETAPPHKPDSRIPATVPVLSGGRTGGVPRGQQSSFGKVAAGCVIILVAVAGVYYGLRHFGASRETSSPAPSSGTQEVQTLPSSSASQAGDSQAKAQVDALILDARSQLESNPGNAQALLEEAVRLDPNHFDAAYQLGRLLTNKKDYQGALQHYQNALGINGQAPEVYFNMGYVYLTLGDYDSAIRSYESCWALKPAYQDEVLTNLGITYMKKNQQERAQALFRQALDANPNNLIARNYLTGASVPSSTQQASPQPPQPKPEEPAILTPTQPAVPAAVETTIASVAKGSVDSLVSQAKTQFDTNPANAQKLLEEAIAQDKNHFDAVFQLGRLLTFRKDHQGAIQQYQKALAINNQAAEVYFNLGYVYMTLKDYNSAISNYEACRALAPPYQDEVFTNLGITYLKKNNMPQAQHLLKQALDLNPNNAIARSYLKNLEKAQGGKVGSAPGVAGADMLAAKPDQQATAAPAQTARLEGKYSVEGTNPSGSTYQGTAVIGKSGERYVMTWNIANQSFSGNGAVSGNKLTINWTGSGGGGGVVVYTVMAGGILKGSWAEGSGSEILTPVR